MKTIKQTKNNDAWFYAPLIASIWNNYERNKIKNIIWEIGGVIHIIIMVAIMLVSIILVGLLIYGDFFNG